MKEKSIISRLLTSIFRGTALITVSVTGPIGLMHLYYSPMYKPSPIKLKEINGKQQERNITIVGAGVVGLTTAYYLSLNPLNKLTIIERNNMPY